MKRLACLASLVFLIQSAQAQIFDYSVTEFQTNYGVLDVPQFARTAEAPGPKSKNVTFTIEHSDGWRYGDNYFFVDLNQGQHPVFNDWDIYLEVYNNFSLSKITGKNWSWGIIRDVGLIYGFNYAKDAKLRKHLPGIRLSLDLPGFAFANLDSHLYIDDTRGVAKGGAPKQGDSFMIDFNWGYPFQLWGQDIQFNGHIEYIEGRNDSFGNRLSWHILTQQHIRWDVGKAWFDWPEKLWAGFEMSIYVNKIGDRSIKEWAPQSLLIYRF